MTSKEPDQDPAGKGRSRHRISGNGLDDLFLVLSPRKDIPSRLIVAKPNAVVITLLRIKPRDDVVAPDRLKSCYLADAVPLQMVGSGAKRLTHRVQFAFQAGDQALLWLDTRTCTVNNFGDADACVGPQDAPFAVRYRFEPKSSYGEYHLLDLPIKNPFVVQVPLTEHTGYGPELHGYGGLAQCALELPDAPG